MNTATVPPLTVDRSTAAPPRPVGFRDTGTAIASVQPPEAGDPPAARAFLTRYIGTLLPLAVALVAVELGWQLLAAGTGTAGQPWPVASAVACGWELVIAAWLRRCGWPTGTVVAAVAAPAAVLAAPAAAGWLSPAGLALWGPVTTVLAVVLALAAQPLVPAGGHATEPTTDA